MTTLPPRASPDDDREWLQLQGKGWVTYEQLERESVCLESGLSPREAGRIAREQDQRWMPPSPAEWGK